MRDSEVGGLCSACTNEPSGEDLCIKHMVGYGENVGTYLKDLVLNGCLDLMGLLDSLDGYERCCGLVIAYSSLQHPFWFAACLALRDMCLF